MRLSFTKDPVRLILGIALVVLGLATLIGVSIPFASTLLALLGIIVGGMMLLRKL
jgi:hypothetical protein